MQEADAAAGGAVVAAVGRTVSEDFPDIVEPARASMRGRGRGRGRGGGRGRGARRKREDDETEMFNPEEGRGKRRKRGAWEASLCNAASLAPASWGSTSHWRDRRRYASAGQQQPYESLMAQPGGSQAQLGAPS